MVAKPLLVLALIGLFGSAGCSSAGTGVSQSALPTEMRSVMRPALGNPASQYISHVVVIIQENRSFENFFAGYPGANAPTYGFVKHGSKQGKVSLRQTTFQTNPNLAHTFQSAIGDWDNGKMDGFRDVGASGGAYQFIERSQVATYWEMAQQYVLADEMFPTEFGGSYTGHLTAIAGTDNMSPKEAQVNYPTHAPNDCDSPPGTTSSLVDESPYRRVGRGNGPFPCFTQFNTMAEVLDGGGVSWKYYVTKLLDAGIWSPFEAIKYVRKGPDWHKDIIAPQTQILTDPGNGNLASVSWVTPSKDDSDHPEARSDLGPSWVASIVNAIGESSYWNSTAIIVIWDDWGGFYDNSPPPQLDFRGLAMRVPCLIISPYARLSNTGFPGYVSHTQYEFGSILKFIEQTFNLPSECPSCQPSAGYTDTRANSLVDSFDFTQSPRAFKPFGSKYPASRFIHEPPSDEPVDTE